MNRRCYISFLLLLLIASGCHKTDPVVPVDPGGDTEYKAPDPPATVNKYNLFSLEFFTKMNSEALFSDTLQTSEMASHIGNAAKVSPLMYFFDRSDVTLGEVPPHLQVAGKVSRFSHFCQNDVSSSIVHGTGIISNIYFSSCSGFAADDGTFVSGCTVSAPLYTATTIVFMTCRIESMNIVKALISRDSTLLQTNGIVLGCVKSGMKDELPSYLSKHFTNFRLMVRDDGTDYSLFVLSPVWYACRNVEKKSLTTLPYYEISIEKLDSTVKK